MVEHDLCVPVPLEVYAERSMPNDSGNALILSKLYSRGTLPALFTQFSGHVNIQTSHQGPCGRFIIAFFPSFTSMAKLDVTRPPTLFVQFHSSKTGFEEGNVQG